MKLVTVNRKYNKSLSTFENGIKCMYTLKKETKLLPDIVSLDVLSTTSIK